MTYRQRYTQLFTYPVLILILFFSLLGCKGKKEASGTSEEEKAPGRSMLTATEMLELCTAPDGAAVQLYMKDKQAVFFHAKKGEYLSLAQGAVTDTMGQPLALPLATLYFASEPGATWRIAQTVHNDSLKNALLQEFISKGFSLQDSVNYYATYAKAYRYTSGQYPDKVLYYSATTVPWFKKGIYLGASWRSHVFEVNILNSGEGKREVEK